MKKTFKILSTLVLVLFAAITCTGCSEETTTNTPVESTTETIVLEEEGLNETFNNMKKSACVETPLTQSYREACLQALSEEYSDRIQDSFLKIEGQYLKLYFLLEDSTYRCFSIDGGRFIETYSADLNNQTFYHVGYEKTEDGYVYVGRIERTELGYMLRDMYY